MDPGTDFFEMERLDDIVVSARTEPVDLVFPTIAGGQYQNRIRLALLTSLANDVQTGQLREPEIDDRQIDRVLQGEIQTFAAVSGLLDRISCLDQLLRERLAQSIVVFDNQ